MAGLGSFIVNTIFKARDQISPTYRRMSGSAVKFGEEAWKAFNKANRGAQPLRGLMSGILGAAVVQRGIGAMATGVGTLTQEFIDFDQAIISTAAKMPGVTQGSKAFLELENAARKAGAETEFTAADAAKAMNAMAMGGLAMHDVMAALPGVTDLATLSEQDMTFATQTAIDALNAFKMTGEEIKDPIERAAKVSQNMGHINDVLAKTLTTSSVSMEDLANTMKYAGPAITKVGGSIEDFGAMAGIMARAGIKSEQAGTAMRASILRLAAPPRMAADAMKRLNLQVKDSEGNMRPLVNIIEDLAIKTENMGTADKAAAMKKIFGMEAFSGMSEVISRGTGFIQEYIQEMKNSEGTAKNMAAAIRKSVKNRLEELRSTLIEVGFKFVDAFKKKFPGAIDETIASIRNIKLDSFIENIRKVWQIFTKIYTVTKNVTLALGDTAEFFGGWQTIKTYATAIGIAYAAIKVATVVQWAFNAALTASPLFWFVAGVVAWGAAIKIVADNWDFLLASGDEFKTMLIDLAGLMVTWNIFVIPFRIIWELLRQISEYFPGFEMFLDKLESGANSLVNTILGGLQKIERYTGILDFLGIKADFGAREREQEEEQKAVKEKIRREQTAKYEGKLLIEGAPKGSTLTEKPVPRRAPPPISVKLLGANP